MIEICPSEKCTGCYACVNVCPKHCISMQPDSLGALHPIINQSLCIDCKLCEKTCPSNNIPSFVEPIECFAVCRNDNSKRQFSASGGIGAVFSEYIIANGGIVFGTKYNEDLIPTTCQAETFEDIQYFKGSKYAQSIVGESYSEIKTLLANGRQVLYIATPCQIAGLLNYLRKPYDNLITVDLLCHGVSPTSYFSDEIAYLRKTCNLNRISNVTFRGNGLKDGYTLNFFLTIFNGDKVTYNKRAQRQYYFSGFLKGVTLRDNCYECQYARPQRVSDITIGDFIGLGDSIPFSGPRFNNSLVIINSEKGKKFMTAVISSNKSELNITKRDYQEAIDGGASLREPFPRHKLTDKFQNLYRSSDFHTAIRKTLSYDILLDYVTYWPIRLLVKAPKKLIRIIKQKFK